MHKYELLRLRANEFLRTLEEYAERDADVADFLQRWMPWYERVCRREIRLPCRDYRLFVYFANPDLSPLAERYGLGHAPNRLLRAASNFSTAMDDMLSDSKYLSHLKALDELPDIIPDQPPPPEEEAPLPESEKPSEPSGLRGFLNRWLNKLR